jgi:hypothetical protein
MRRAWLHAFLDDHSRLLLAGRWAFRADRPTLEVVFREALRRCGIPQAVYYDNGGPYRSHHMAQIVAVLSQRRPIFTTPHRPEGHGKIEAFNRHCRAAFVDEVSASSITNLDDLNRAFDAWKDLKYNRKTHTETGQAPWDRWRAALDRIVHVDETTLASAFLFRASRTTDKTGVFGLHGVRYQTGPALAAQKVEVRYDPERMATVEVWSGTTFQERVKPLDPSPVRRPKPPTPAPAAAAATAPPLVDYLGHLVAQHTPVDLGDPLGKALEDRTALDERVVDVIRSLLAPEVFDLAEVREFVGRYGPLDPEPVRTIVSRAVELGGRDQHIHTLLKGLRDALGGVA